MAFDKTILLERWETPCSDAEGLFIVRLVEEAGLMFCVKDTEFEYTFKFEDFGPYQVADEAFLEAYQIDIKEHYARAESTEKPLGWTRLVSNSLWEKSFNEGLMHHVYFRSGLQHYSIQTWDSCLDILAPHAPVISVSRLTVKKQTS
jgi:hypothetical protein